MKYQLMHTHRCLLAAVAVAAAVHPVDNVEEPLYKVGLEVGVIAALVHAGQDLVNVRVSLPDDENKGLR
jgi:hypothetical protein